MKLLVLGGTRFLGKHIVNEALKRGHEVTMFNRGQTNPELFPNVEKLTGDRDGNLSALEGRKWDAVIDTCGYVPRIVRQSAEFLANTCGSYAFISTISVYADFSEKGIKESAAVGTLEDESTEEVTGESYGPLKALCEQEVLKAYPEGALIIRPGLIVGPDDQTDRFTYWPVRVAEGGPTLAPGNPDAPVQVIDVRDLALFTLKLLEDKKTGTYNVTGPLSPLTLEQFLNQCKTVLNSDSEFVWASDDFIKDQEIGQWVEMPLYIPERDNMGGMLAVDISKAVGDGLELRSLDETIVDTVNWDQTRNIKEEELKAGLKREKEQKALAALNVQKA